jgi:hypothetical protein
MRYLYILFFCCLVLPVWSQEELGAVLTPGQAQTATIDMYRIITAQRDTTYVDTSLTIKSHYKHNYLRRDLFGLMSFANEGQPYTELQFSLKRQSVFPEFGRHAKHYSFVQPEDIRYYSVATPFTELYFKSVMEQGQSVNALVAVNTSEQLNFSIGYRGLRSLGKYINQLTSTGNFRFTTSYTAKNQRYWANFHYAGQDILNGENGGIVSTNDFESDNPDFENRARLEVYFKDAKSMLIGRRMFLDHGFRINPKDAQNDIAIFHRFTYNYKFFEFAQSTVASTITNSDGSVATLNRYGQSYVGSNLHDQSRYNSMYNRLGAVYDNETLGQFQFFVEDFRYNYYFDKILILDSGVVPGSLNDEIQTLGGQYTYRKDKWNGSIMASNTLAGPAMSNIEARLTYRFNDENSLSLRYQNLNKIPDHTYNLYQSRYVAYNWSHDFKNEKVNVLEGHLDTQWGQAWVNVQTLNDHLFFVDQSIGGQEFVKPAQYDKTIGYLSVKVGRDFKLGKFGFDNTLMYQEVTQDDPVLNVPKFVTRNTVYFSHHFFKKALFTQSGVTFNYFTKYHANGYSPLLGEFFVQNTREIGNFPMLDVFINAQVRTCRIFFTAEHVNTLFTKPNYYSAPGYPYRDFMIRFGLVWNFFQ